MTRSSAFRLPDRLRFPDVVDEVSARIVAGLVVALTVVQLASGSTPVLAALALGFVLRVIAGPNLSPLALLATRVIRPRLPVGARPTAGPPKRFAQAIGATLSTAALVAALAGAPTLAVVLVAMITVAATLESAFGLCLGCVAFARLMAWGLVPDDVCEACADLRLRPATVRS